MTKMIWKQSLLNRLGSAFEHRACHHPRFLSLNTQWFCSSQSCQPVSALSPGVAGVWCTCSSQFLVLSLFCIALVTQVLPACCHPDSWAWWRTSSFSSHVPLCLFPHRFFSPHECYLVFRLVSKCLFFVKKLVIMYFSHFSY